MSSYLSQFLTSPWAQPTAGEAIAYRDLVQLAADGRAYKCDVADYAAVNQPGYAIAGSTELSTAANTPNPCAGSGRGVAVNSANGDIFFVVCDSTTGGLVLHKRTRTGINLGTLTLGFPAGTMQTVNVAFLSTGNLLVTAANSASTIGGFFAIIEPYAMVAIVPFTSVNNSSSVNTIGMSTMVLASGGWMALYAIGTASTLQLSKYSDAGVLLGSVTIGSAAQTLAIAYGLAIVQLVGTTDILVGYMASAGNAYMIARFTIASTPVIVGAATDTVLDFVGSTVANLAAVDGYFAVALTNADAGTNAKARVYNNAFALQGSTITSPNAQSMASILATRILTTDGTSFYLFFNCIIKILVTGSSTTYYLTAPFDSNHLGWTSAYDGCGNLVATGTRVASGANESAQYLTFSLVLLQQVVPPTETYLDPTNNTALGNCCPILPIGDTVCCFNVSNMAASAGALFTLIKTSQTQILGPAAAAVAQGVEFPVNNIAAGVFPINQIMGTIPSPYISALNGGGQILGNQLMQLDTGGVNF